MGERPKPVRASAGFVSLAMVLDRCVVAVCPAHQYDVKPLSVPRRRVEILCDHPEHLRDDLASVLPKPAAVHPDQRHRKEAPSAKSPTQRRRWSVQRH